MPGLSGIKALASTQEHVLALAADGRVYAWGVNSSGQLGLGDTRNRNAPALISSLADVTGIAAGQDFSLALKTDGSLWAWGNNTNGALGIGAAVSGNTPAKLPGLAGITKIIASKEAGFAIGSAGEVWGVGPNYRGATRIPLLDGSVQFAGRFSDTLVLKPDGTVWRYLRDRGLENLVQVAGITDAAGVAHGDDKNYIWRRDGTVLAWGSNNYGQLGDGTLASRLTPVLVVNETFDGPLDLAPEVPNSVPQQFIPPYFLAAQKSGSLASTTLSADLRGKGPSGALASANDTGRFAAGYNVYVAASVPSGTSSMYFQLDSANIWS